MGILRYYWQVLGVAITRTPSVAQDILFVIFIVGGAVVYGLREAGMIADASPWMNEITGWQIAAIVLGSIFIVRLLLAPYWLYKEKCTEVLPIQNCLDVIFETPDITQKTHHNRLVYSFGVRNLTSHRSVQDVRLRCVDGQTPRWALLKQELLTVDELHPGQTETVNVLQLPIPDLTGIADAELSIPLRFDLEVIGRDVSPSRAQFEYDPASPIKIRRLP